MNVDKLRGWFGFKIRFIEKVDAIVFKPRENIEWLLPDGPKSEWKEYKRRVWKLTNLVSSQIPGVEKRGFKDHHIDHIISIWRGYRTGMTVKQIASLDNLRMLPYKENMKKGIK